MYMTEVLVAHVQALTEQAAEEAEKYNAVQRLGEVREGGLLMLMAMGQETVGVRGV
jgi:hypothetical protein